MNRRKRKLMCSVMVLSMIMAGTTTACGANTNTNQTTAQSEASVTNVNTFEYTDGSDTPTSTTVNAKVVSISDNTMSLSTGGGNMDTPPSGDMSSSEAPDGNAPADDVSDNSTANGSTNSTSTSNTAVASNTTDTQPTDAASNTSQNMPPAKPDDTSDNSGDTQSTPPEKPDVDSSSDASQGTPPEMPDGDNSNGGAQGAPDNNGSGGPGDQTMEPNATLTLNDTSVLKHQDSTDTASLSDISEGSMLSLTFDESGNITEIAISDGMADGMGNAPMGGGGQSSAPDSYTSVNEYSEDATVDGETITSTGTDENAVLVDSGANVNLNNVTIDRTSSDSTGGDNSSFYGVGATVLTTDGTTKISDATIKSSAKGAAGVFSYNNGVTYVSDSDITTTEDTSGGIHVAGGGTLYAKNLNVDTSGESSAAIRSDRGGGTMVVDGGTYASHGTGSPAVYCTADISVNDATLTATGSEAVCIEGLNSLHLFNCDVSGNMSDSSQNDTTWTMIIYQSMSGDSEIGESTMQMVGGSLTSENGGLLYTTNTECNLLMSDVDITYADDSEFFLRCTGNANERGWGTTGANGSQCTFTADTQDMQGDVIWDSISELDFYMTNGSSLTGAFVDDESYAGNGGNGYCNVYISKDSTWTVTGDSIITNLYNAGTIVDKDGNTVSVVGTDGTVYVKGNSSYTITVSNYSDSADLSGAATADTWADKSAGVEF